MAVCVSKSVMPPTPAAIACRWLRACFTDNSDHLIAAATSPRSLLFITPFASLPGIFEHHAFCRQLRADGIGAGIVFTGFGSLTLANQRFDAGCVQFAALAAFEEYFRRLLQQAQACAQGVQRDCQCGFAAVNASRQIKEYGDGFGGIEIIIQRGDKFRLRGSNSLGWA